MENHTTPLEEPRYPIEAVDKALQLLLLFRDRREVRLIDAHTELAIGKSRAHRLLAMLVYHRLVVQDPVTKAYRAGPALLEIGLSAVTTSDVRATARPFLEQLAALSGETVHLGVLEDAQVRFMDCIESDLALRVSGRVGRIVPAYATSLGKAMLATLPEAQVLRLYPMESLPPLTSTTVRRRSELLAELERTRQQGYAVNYGGSEEGVSSLAVAVLDASGSPVAALGVAAPADRFERDDLLNLATPLQQAASDLRRILNGSHSQT